MSRGFLGCARESSSLSVHLAALKGQPWWGQKIVTSLCLMGYHTNTLGISFADAYGSSMTRSKRPSFGELMNSCINCLNKTSSSFPRRMPWIQDNIAITRNTGMHAAGICGRIRFSCGKLWGFLNSEADERLHISFKRWPKMFPRWSSLVIR